MAFHDKTDGMDRVGFEPANGGEKGSVISTFSFFSNEYLCSLRNFNDFGSGELYDNNLYRIVHCQINFLSQTQT